MSRPVQLLLVEDNPGDARLALEALKEGGVPNALEVVEDGVEALAYLRREGKYGAAPRPDLILLDLRLPRKNGFEVLAEIKADPALKRIPVLVLSTTGAEDDIFHAYDRHANCFLTKPHDLDKFVALVRSIESFWLSFVELPPA